MIKRPHTALVSTRFPWPSVIVYVDSNETQVEVLNHVKQWLYGTNGRVKLVIVITTSERGRPPLENSWLDGIDCSAWASAEQLGEQIFEVERTEERPSLIGQIVSSVWFMTIKDCSEDNIAFQGLPFFEFKCDISRGLQEGSVNGDFEGVSCVDSDCFFHLDNVKIRFPFEAYCNSVHRSVMKYLRSRAMEVAIGIWSDYRNRIGQENIVRASYATTDLLERPYSLPYC